MAATAAACSAGLALASASPPGSFLGWSGGDYFVPGGFTSGDITGLYGSVVGQPGEPDQYQGHQTFTVYSPDGKLLGTFDALVGDNYVASNPHQEVFVDSVNPASGVSIGTQPGQMPAVGSIFNYGGDDFFKPTYMYSSLAGYDVHDPGAATTGDAINSSSFAFDGSAHIDVHHLGVRDMSLPHGGYLTADPASAETYTGVSNTPPFAEAIQGTQVYDVYDSSGQLVGKVDALTTSTADFAGGHSQEVFVVGIVSGSGVNGADPTIGMADGDVPSVGSVFNFLDYFGAGSSEYTDYAADPSAGIDRDTTAVLWDLLGLKFTGSTSFDTVAGLTNGTDPFTTIPLSNGASIVTTGGPIGYSTASENYYTGINGEPNGGVSSTSSDVQSFQHFILTDHAASIPFAADVTAFGNGSETGETLYIQSIGANSLGLQDGSTIEYTDTGLIDTMVMKTNPIGLGSGTDDVTQTISIPMLGIDNVTVDSGWDGLLGLFGVTF